MSEAIDRIKQYPFVVLDELLAQCDSATRATFEVRFRQHVNEKNVLDYVRLAERTLAAASRDDGTAGGET